MSSALELQPNHRGWLFTGDRMVSVVARGQACAMAQRLFTDSANGQAAVWAVMGRAWFSDVGWRRNVQGRSSESLDWDAQ